ncbi:hypothetical protein B0H16DRAFT_1480236 [Mycena metata]|uniref:Uncharacterized protein n=1 Tax=Mycena metata TaxID=1033252 RepID=A0AAD7MD22_9AGAR|nr:hypothetical protein B0H16DRAFT_1480236 [Mycena metata]
MPESQVSNVKAYQIRNDLSDEFGPKEVPMWPEGHLRIFLQTFALGTAAKSYTTLSVDVGNYQDSQEPYLSDAISGYLALKKLEPETVHVAVRGKCLALCAGYHVLICHLGLEGNPAGNITSMTRSDCKILTAPWYCIPGVNEDEEKAEKMCSFLLADKFHELTARQLQKPTVNVLAAIITEERPFVVTDFNHLTRLHVVSSSRKFTSEDLLSCSLFVLLLARRGKSVFGKLSWGGPTGRLSERRLLRISTTGGKKKKCIIDVLLDAHGPGGGIGKHRASDFMFEVVLHPDTSAIDVCTHNVLYDQLRTRLPIFMARWTSPEFLKACGSRTNSLTLGTCCQLLGLEIDSLKKVRKFVIYSPFPQ